MTSSGRISFSRQTMLHPQPTNLGSVVEEIVSMLRRAIDPRIVIAFEPQLELWPVAVDQNQMHQVLMNLSINARDAMPKGGELRFTTANVVLDEDFTSRHPEAPWPT